MWWCEKLKRWSNISLVPGERCAGILGGLGQRSAIRRRVARRPRARATGARRLARILDRGRREGGAGSAAEVEGVLVSIQRRALSHKGFWQARGRVPVLVGNNENRSDFASLARESAGRDRTVYRVRECAAPGLESPLQQTTFQGRETDDEASPGLGKTKK